MGNEVPFEVGYLVLTVTHGLWRDDWDGVVHLDISDAQREHVAAVKAGCTAMIVEARPFTPLGPSGGR